MNSHPLSRFSQAFILRTRNPVIAVCLHISHLSTLFLSHSQSHHTCFIIGPFSMSPSHVSCSLSCRSRFDGSPDMPIECCVSTHHPHSLSHRTPMPPHDLFCMALIHLSLSVSLSLSISPSLTISSLHHFFLFILGQFFLIFFTPSAACNVYRISSLALFNSSEFLSFQSSEKFHPIFNVPLLLVCVIDYILHC